MCDCHKPSQGLSSSGSSKKKGEKSVTWTDFIFYFLQGKKIYLKTKPLTIFKENYSEHVTSKNLRMFDVCGMYVVVS